jgi:hypothetical protein
LLLAVTRLSPIVVVGNHLLPMPLMRPNTSSGSGGADRPYQQQ